MFSELGFPFSASGLRSSSSGEVASASSHFGLPREVKERFGVEWHPVLLYFTIPDSVQNKNPLNIKYISKRTPQGSGTVLETEAQKSQVASPRTCGEGSVPSKSPLPQTVSSLHACRMSHDGHLPT